MSEVTARTLRLLDLLQSRSVWSGDELAAELGVTTRSIRRDIDRLRELGYPVLATAGHGGGYQLGPGRSLPPLLLEQSEAVAMAVSLQLAATSGIDGLADGAVRALTKLDQVLPPKLRPEIAAVTESVDVPAPNGPVVDAELLRVLARAVRDGVRLEFGYTAADGRASSRRTEPYRVLAIDRRWYLHAFDLDRDDWRVFRLDRIREPRASTLRFEPRVAPDSLEAVRQARAYQPGEPMQLRILAPLHEVRERMPEWLRGDLEAIDDDTTLLTTRGDPRWVAALATMSPFDFVPVGPPQLAEAVADLATKLGRAHSVASRDNPR
ncbi:helix-turn-helix transcriptional regulator [Gulosibacter massiliensis]|uniref:helix-turn-helix transcriptional regulator n=1 Tax=Gulosibacter massiliensis TaxID=2479839 RepID=UPI000F63F4CE|nr:YafY family protein [Gulosibacter massiliensis]